MTMWYQYLWSQRVNHYFYEAYNAFMSKFKKKLFGEDTSKLLLEVLAFLKGKKNSRKKWRITISPGFSIPTKNPSL